MLTHTHASTCTLGSIGMKGSAGMLGAWQWACVGVWSVSVSFSAGMKSSSVVKANLSLVPNGKGKAERVRRQWEGVGEIKKKGEIKARDGYFWWKGEEREVLILARRARLPWGENVVAECKDADRFDRGPRTHNTHTLTLLLTAWVHFWKFALRQEFPSF